MIDMFAKKILSFVFMQVIKDEKAKDKKQKAFIKVNFVKLAYLKSEFYQF